MKQLIGRLALFVVCAFVGTHSAIAQTRTIELKATSMVYCPQDSRIYATAAQDAKGALANSVCRINPTTGKIEASVFAGSDLRGIVRSTDGKSLYVLTADNRSIRQIDRATLTAGISIPVGENMRARRLAPVPDVPDAVIVHRYNPNISPQQDNLCVFVKGKEGQGIPCGTYFAYGIDPTRVITSGAYDNANFYFGLNAVLHTEDGTGFDYGRNFPLMTNAYGLVLSDNGTVVDPETHLNLGRIPFAGNEVCVDPVRPVVYEVFDERAPTLRCWDLQTFRELWKSPLPTWDGSQHPSAPLRWGKSGFAYMDGDWIICGPWNLGDAANPVDLSVTRSGAPTGNLEGRTFSYTLTVKNNSDFPSTGAFLSDTIPGVVEVLSTTASQGTALFTQGTIRADLGSIPAHGSATLQVKVRVQNRGSGGYVAVVRSFDPDPDTSNNIYPGLQFTPHSKFDLTGLPTPGKAGNGSITASWKALSRQASGVGQDLQIRVNGELEIVNSGSASTKPMVVRFYLQDGPNLVVDWASFLQEVEIPALAPGRKYSVTLAVPFSADGDIVGMYVVANIDPTRANGSTVNTSNKIQ